jgi:hypothetical protein
MKGAEIQAPTSKKIPMTKYQIQNCRRSAIISASSRFKLGASLVLGCWCLVLFLPSGAQGQSYSIDRHKIAGGGGTSTGGVYSVSGTIGQHDAGKMSGGGFALEGGFWSAVAAVQTPGAPLLSMSVNAQLSTVTLSWPPPATGFVLQQNGNLANPSGWAPVVATPQTNANQISVTIPLQSGNTFFRLRKP